MSLQEAPTMTVSGQNPSQTSGRHRPLDEDRVISAMTEALRTAIGDEGFMVREGARFRIDFSSVREVDLAVLSRRDYQREIEYRPTATWIDTVPLLMVLVSVGPARGSARGLDHYRGRGTNTVWQVDLKSHSIHVMDANGFHTYHDRITLPHPFEEVELDVPTLLGKV